MTWDGKSVGMMAASKVEQMVARMAVDWVELLAVLLVVK